MNIKKVTAVPDADRSLTQPTSCPETSLHLRRGPAECTLGHTQNMLLVLRFVFFVMLCLLLFKCGAPDSCILVTSGLSWYPAYGRRNSMCAQRGFK